MTIFFDFATVKEYGGILPDGEAVKPARVSTLGSTPGSILAKLYQFGTDPADEDDVRPRWRDYDTIEQGVVTNNDDGSCTISGVSQKMRTEVGLSVEDSMVRWEIVPQGCKSCR